jgi:septal ring factor EnvC (AmiA/AmiB activator)
MRFITRKKVWGILLIIAITLVTIPVVVEIANAEETSAEEANATEERSEEITQAQKEIADLEDQIKQYEKKVKQLQSEKSTLQNEVDYADNQIYITQLRIQATENQIAVTEDRIRRLGEDIDNLATRLDRIEGSMEYQEDLLSLRKREYYKVEQAAPKELNILLFLLEPLELEKKIQKTTYSKIMQERDKKLLDEMDKTKIAYTNQKDIFEDKRSEEEVLKDQIEQQKSNLDEQKDSLERQKEAKQQLLIDTQNNETKYQALLEQARQEYLSLQAILAGSGVEDSGSFVKAGQTIGSVISGASCNSSGTHLHFTVRKDGSTRNPFNYLKEISDYSNCSGPGSCSAGDSFNPSGDWGWPLRGHIRMHQGYGYSWAVQNTWVRSIYSFHDGIDISSDQLTLYAVDDGTYYQGYYDTGACRLQYIRIDHQDDLQSYYLHVNY